MERNREARRGGAMPSVNGGLSSSRRRQRSSGGGGGLRDSPEEDGGAMEMQEGTRLRERSKKERERSGRSKRRRSMIHGGGGGGDGDDSSDESVDDDDEEDYDEPSSVGAQTMRLPPPVLPPGNSSNNNSNGSNSNNPLMQQNQLSSSPNHHHHSHHQQQNQQLLQHNQNHHHHHHHQHQQHRKGVAAAPSMVTKAPRAPGVWKAAADEMIGVSVPRKARSASAKRSHECWVSGSGGGGGGGVVVMETVSVRQPSTSPGRPSPSSSAPISPSSSNASIRKKLKPSSGIKHRPPKISKPQSSSVQDIEFEVAEVLFGMTRQFPVPPKPEINKSELKETLNGSGGEIKSRVSSPNSGSALPTPSILPLPNSCVLPGIVAPKRKRPRPMKPEDESPLNHAAPLFSISPSSKIDGEQGARLDLPPAKLENISSLVVENGVLTHDLRSPLVSVVQMDVQEAVKTEIDLSSSESRPPVLEAGASDQVEAREEVTNMVSLVEDLKHSEASEKKVSHSVGSPGNEKFQIDLMAPPPGKPSAEEAVLEEFDVHHKAVVPEETAKNVETRKMEEERKDDTERLDLGGSVMEPKAESRSGVEEAESSKPSSKEPNFDLHLDIPKKVKEEMGNNRQQQKHQQLASQQQSKPVKTDLKSEKSVQPGASPSPMSVPSWHPGLPPFGYLGQLPSLVPIDGTAGPAKSMQTPRVLVPPQRPKRCATHCYIAQCIHYNQQMQQLQLSRYWQPAAGATAFFGAKPQYNVNGLQPSESVAVLGNTLQGGGFPGRNIGSLQDMGNPAVAAAFGGITKDKNPAAVNVSLDSSQRKQLVLQQPPQAVSANNMMTPAFVFPFNQQQAAAAAALGRSGPAAKSGNGATATAPSTSAAVGSSTVPASGATTMSFNYTNLPQGEAPYVAILQNNGYPFPIPAAHVGGLPQFRGNSPQAMPFFSGSFYPSQMLHPAQLQQQPTQSQQPQQQSQQATAVGQQGQQNNKSTSSGSSSSQKQQQQQRVPGVGGTTPSHGFPTTKLPHHLPTGRPSDAETGTEDTPSSADSRVLSAHRGIYGPNFSMPMHPQSITLMSASSDKQTHVPPSSQSSPSQAFTVSFPSLNGVTPPLGIDFSASQNHPMFQNIPETARQNYQMAAVVAAAAAANQAAQQKKPENKTCTTEPVEEERKAMMAAAKSPVNFSQHSLAFAATNSHSLSNAVVESSSRTINMAQPPSGGGRSSNRPASAAPSSGPASSFGSHHQQQQAHIVHQQIQRQQQHQQQHQQIMMQQQQLASRSKTTASTSSSPTLYTTDRLAPASAVPKFLGGFPQTVVVQGSVAGAAASSQSNQWKNANRSATQAPVPSQSQPGISSGKNQITQQQSRGASQPSSLSSQTQISFSAATSAGIQKLPPQSGQHMAGGSSASNQSPQPSISKGGGGSGSPRSSVIGKQGAPLSATLPLQQQSQQTKSSSGNSSHKSSPAGGRNAPSILGQPHIVPPPQGSGSKQQMDQMQQHFPQAPFYFSSPYIPSQTQANPMAQGFYPRPQQQQQSSSPQPNSTSSSTGMLSLCPPALTLGGATATTEPGKSATASNMKNMPPQNLLQAAHLAAVAAGSVQQRPLISAPGFPYIHAVSSVSVKPVEQKPATGNDNLHACWQPEKR